MAINSLVNPDDVKARREFVEMSAKLERANPGLKRERDAEAIGRYVEGAVTRGIRSAAAPTQEERTAKPHEARWRRYLETGRGAEARDLGATGAFLTPPAFFRQLFLAVQNVSPIVQRSTQWSSPNGSPGSFPVVNDLGTNASTFTENAQMTETDPTVAHVSFGQCPAYTSAGVIRYSRQLAADSGIDVEGFLRELFARRLARALDAALLSTLSGAASTTVVTSAAPTAIAYNDLAALAFATDQAYLGAPTAGFVCNFATLAVLAKIVDSSGRPVLLWHESDDFEVADDGGISGSRPTRYPTLFGAPVFTSAAMPNVAATQKALIFADFAKAGVVRVPTDPSIKVLQERYAEFGELGAVFYARYDYQPTGFGASVLAQHA